jgi:hypothetical protein
MCFCVFKLAEVIKIVRLRASTTPWIGRFKSAVDPLEPADAFNISVPNKQNVVGLKAEKCRRL